MTRPLKSIRRVEDLELCADALEAYATAIIEYHAEFGNCNMDDFNTVTEATILADKIRQGLSEGG